MKMKMNKIIAGVVAKIGSKLFNRVINEAEETINDESKFKKFNENLKKKIVKFKDTIKSVIVEINRLIEIFRSKDVKLFNKILAVAALIYFIMPFDLIPDFLGAGGFLDDIFVITTMLKSIMNTTTDEIREDVL